MRDDTVVVLGLGDLGGRVVEALARLPVGRVVAVARRKERAREVAGQAALVARLTGGATWVEPAVADLEDVEATSRLLAAAAPSIVVAAAARHTWWRAPDELAELPYGAWLPLQVGLVRAAVQARDAAGVRAPVVALPYPDAVGPVLAPQGLAPEAGAGNVAEVAAKLRVLAAGQGGCDPSEVAVRVVAHHAAERLAFGTFGVLGGAGATTSPPVRLEVAVRGTPLAAERARALFDAPYPLPAGRETHGMTAAATVEVVAALLGAEPRRIHVPSPGGRPGGYPVTASRDGLALDLPAGMTEADAVAVNAVAARWDGIERIAPDGTVTFTPDVTDGAARLLGVELAEVAPGDLDAVAEALSRARARARA